MSKRWKLKVSISKRWKLKIFMFKKWKLKVSMFKIEMETKVFYVKKVDTKGL